MPPSIIARYVFAPLQTCALKLKFCPPPTACTPSPPAVNNDHSLSAAHKQYYQTLVMFLSQRILSNFSYISIGIFNVYFPLALNMLNVKTAV